MRTDLRKHRPLIEELNELFPLTNFKADVSLDAIRFACGSREVVEFLLRQLAEQEAANEIPHLFGDS